MNEHMVNYPAYVGWDVTGNCNHKCFYCYNYWRTEKSIFSGNKAKNYNEIADFIVSKRPAVVILSGGEPLLVFDKIKQHIVRFYNNGIFVRMLTNGSLITEEIARFCKEYQINLMVSFPSVDRNLFAKITNNETNYDCVINGMDLLHKYEVSFSPNIVVSKMNLEDFQTTAKWLIEKYHPQKLFISRVTRPANASNLYDQFVLEKDDLTRMFQICEQIGNTNQIDISGCGGFPFCIFPSERSLRMFGKRCGAGKNGYCVDMAGNVRACARDSESIGNIFDDDFLAIRSSLIEWGERKDIPNKCNNCRVANICRGGCRMTNEDNLRNGKAVDCDADPEKAPKKMPYNWIRVSPFKNFSVRDNLKWVEFNGIYRVSYLHHITYLEKRFADYVMSKKEINILKVMWDLHVSFFRANRYITQLLSVGLIQA